MPRTSPTPDRDPYLIARFRQARHPRRADDARAYLATLHEVPLRSLARWCDLRARKRYRRNGGRGGALESLVLRIRLERLWAEVADDAFWFEVASRKQARELADAQVGAATGERRGRAVAGELDAVADAVRERRVKLEQAAQKPQRAVHHVPSPQANELIVALDSMPGRKRVTLVVDRHAQTWTVHRLSDHGRVLFAKRLDDALAGHSSMLVRQQVAAPHEACFVKEQAGTWSILYAVLFKNGTWYPLPAELVEECCNQDLQGIPLPPEERAMYGDFAQFCNASRAPVRRTAWH